MMRPPRTRARRAVPAVEVVMVTGTFLTALMRLGAETRSVGRPASGVAVGSGVAVDVGTGLAVEVGSGVAVDVGVGVGVGDVGTASTTMERWAVAALPALSAVVTATS